MNGRGCQAGFRQKFVRISVRRSYVVWRTCHIVEGETKPGAATAWSGHCHGTSAPAKSASVAASNLSATTTRAAIGGQASGLGRSRSGLATEIAEHLVVCHAITRGVAYIPRLEVVGAIEVEHLRPVVFPFNQNQFSLDKRLGATKNLEGGKVRRTSGEPLSKYHAFPIGACHRGCGPKTCLERLARKGPSEKTSLTRKRSPPSVRRIRKLP